MCVNEPINPTIVFQTTEQAAIRVPESVTAMRLEEHLA